MNYYLKLEKNVNEKWMKDMQEYYYETAWINPFVKSFSEAFRRHMLIACDAINNSHTLDIIQCRFDLNKKISICTAKLFTEYSFELMKEYLDKTFEGVEIIQGE